MGSRLENKSSEVRKRIENHTFDSEAGDEYEGSKFGGFSDYFRRKKIKLQNLDADIRARSADKPQLFRGIVAHVNGYTQPSLNDLHELIVSHGGGFIQYLDGKTIVTHIIASNLTPKKAVEFKKYRIVKPAWIVESVDAGRLLPWNDYRVLDEGVGQRLLGFDNGQVVSQANVRTKGYRDQTANSWYTSQFKKQQSSLAVQTEDSSLQKATASPPTAENFSFDESDFDRLEEAAHQAERHTALPPSDRSPSPQHHRPASADPIASPELQASTQLTSSRDVGDGDIEVTVASKSSINRARSPEADTAHKATKLTAEEHNAILLADPRIRKSTVVNPDFLEQYYRESRLHHLSTWKADLKSQMRALTEEKTSSQQAKQKRPAGARRYIMHVDFDSFFVAVSLKKCPQYKEKPCVVAHGGGTGSEIASCNYPARKFGVSNGMWMKKAQELCKDLEVLPYDFPAYEEASRKFYDAILATGGIVQSVSIDEALVDISMLCIAVGGTNGIQRNEGGAHREEAKADEIAQQLRKTVLESTGCNVSIGIGGNILLAKVALRKAKPAGQFHLRPDLVLDFIGALEVQSLPGVAWSLGGKLEELGVRYVKDIRECTKEKLITKLGPKTGEKLWDYSRGIDRVEVGDVVIRKSVSAEVNWGVRFENQEQVDEFIESLCVELQKRLIKEKVKGKQLTVKIMRRSADAPLDPPKHLGHGKCDTYNKSVQLGVCTNDAKTICKEALSTMKGFGFTPGELRGIGLQMQKLESIKGDGILGSSQRRLHFKQDTAESAQKVVPSKATDPIQDDIETPETNRTKDMNIAAIPMKLLNTPSKKPLNVMGTQFVMPTQVDPSVLAELPEDIRSKLTRHLKSAPSPPGRDVADPPDKPDAERLASKEELTTTFLPNQSQLDAETIAALPDDVRAEVLGFYRTNPKPGNQAVLPQSPRKNRVLPPSKPTVSRRGRPRGNLFASHSTRNDTSTLTQSNFIARSTSRATPDPDSGTPEPDADFLAALPPELRAEVLANHRQERLRRTGGIDTSLHARPARKQAKSVQQAAVERLFKLPAREAKPTFTKAGLSELADLREMIRGWVAEFWDEEPFEEDVVAIVEYLGEVVKVERDVDKAVRVVKWLAWVVEEDSADRWEGDEMRGRWGKVVRRVREAVQKAVAERGLGPVDLG
ncbi:DNA repair protein [Myriangium duriaei CBS 260.36]|uniref:DNA repair protein REV1 n=1 Tax=Myriangium duriaei CBS 260.36 TaxID=1168546 RepID=A0A9P4JE97_9PEZI|nr:DNA repair protein [Myriangium duriaei CBS 260.36]